MNLPEFTTEMNRLGQAKVPFLFVVDFELEKPMLLTLSDLDPANILYDLNGFTNAGDFTADGNEMILLNKFPSPLETYQHKFDDVFRRLEYGDSFLTNLTVKTEVRLNKSLREIFYQSHARYKLFVKDKFLVFSPEIFIQIIEGKIRSFPMKGTIDAAIPGARETILKDRKELSEHVTIVDLIRNDLSQIARQVQVEKFRYIEEIRTEQKVLLQVSSMIEGTLEEDYSARLGDILIKLLPAGSVSGAPKQKTMEIIKNVEGEKRGYYTGVFGVFNGSQLDSGVMIRFIEKTDDRYFYRSGGGITTQSNATQEYQEAIDKVYVPLA